MSFEFNGRMRVNYVKQNNNFVFEHRGVRLSGINEKNSVFFVYASQSQLSKGKSVGQKSFRPYQNEN